MNIGSIRFSALAVWSLASFVQESSASQACTDAYAAFRLQREDLCDTTGLSLNQLLTETCPTACQALFDQVSIDCNVGDQYKSGSTETYLEDTLFSVAGAKWAMCDYGYQVTACERAFHYFDYLDGCFNPEKLDGENCPQSCQDLTDHVVANCKPGIDTVDYNTDRETGLRSPVVYEKAFLWHEGPSDIQCDYGYDPTPCDLAVQALDESGFDVCHADPPPDLLLPCNAYFCSDQCRQVIDKVLLDCPVGAKFAPSRGYSTYELIPFEGSQSIEMLGLDPAPFYDFTSRLSDKCWSYYTSASPPLSHFLAFVPPPETPAPTPQTTTPMSNTTSSGHPVIDNVMVRSLVMIGMCFFF